MHHSGGPRPGGGRPGGHPGGRPDGHRPGGHHPGGHRPPPPPMSPTMGRRYARHHRPHGGCCMLGLFSALGAWLLGIFR